MKLNNKGFTLIELLAVVVIMSILVAIMVPSVNSLINMQKENSNKDLEKSIISATRVFVSDNKYDIGIESACNTNTEEKNVTNDNIDIINNKSVITIAKLIDLGNLKPTKSVITNAKTGKTLNTNESYVILKYSCNKKNIIIDENITLIWQ